MAKGDTPGGIGVGYNPGGPRMGGMASYGSQPMPSQMLQQRMQPMGGGGQQMGSLGPSPNMMQNLGTTAGSAFGNMGIKPQPMPNDNTGPSPNFNMDAIMSLLNGGQRMRPLPVGGGMAGGTPTTPPMQPNSYALNPSANLMNNRNNQYS